MVTYQEIVQLAGGLTAQEKLELVQSLLLQLYSGESSESGIVKTDGVCGGSARIANTRIPVRSIVEAKQHNTPDADLLAAYPTIGLKDIENALVYYAKHREEIEGELLEEETL